MELQEAIDGRRSIRRYDGEKKVSKEDLETLIVAAQQAPSWKNTQTGRYCVVCSDEMKKKVMDCLPSYNAKNAEGAAAIIVTSFVKDRSGYDVSKGTPVNEIGNGWGMYDLGLQNENLMLKAKDLGLDTLVMGNRDAEALKEILDIDDSEEIGPVILLGYPAEEPWEKKRKPTEEVVRFF